MKKVILFVSMAISVICATNQNLSEEVAKENQLGQNLKLDVKVTIPKEVIKYVVYSTNDKEKTIKDTLELPVFYLSQDSTKAGFQNIKAPTVHTRMIKNGKIDTATDVKVTYTLTHPDGFFSTGVQNTVLESNGNELQIIPTSLLSKNKLQEVVKAMGSDYRVSSSGEIIKGGDDSTMKYSPAAILKFKNTNGELTVESVQYNNPNKLPAEDIIRVENLLAGETKIAEGVHFVVQVK